MKCPSCESPFTTKTEKNYINKKDENGKIKVGHQLLMEFVPVYLCDTCGVVWTREPERLA